MAARRPGICTAALLLGLALDAPAQGPPSEAEVRLPPLIHEALRQNPEVAAARARVEAARARIPQARTLPDPTVSLGTQVSSDLSRRLENELAVAQTLPFPGKLGLQALVARYEADQTAEELRAKEREVAARVKVAFYELFRAHRFIGIKQGESETLKTFARIAQTRYEVDRASQQDVLKAQVELSRALTEFVILEQERETAQSALNAVLYRSPRDPIGTPVPREFEPFVLRFDELEQRALSQRPEIAAAQRSFDRAQAAVELANRQYFPDFTVGAAYTGVNGASDKVKFFVSINIPWLYTKPRYDARVEEAVAQRAAARATQEAVRIETLAGVKDRFERVKAFERLVTLYRTSLLPQASQALEAAIAGYQTGKVDFLTLLDNQRALAQTERAHVTAWTEFEQRQAELERVVGADLGSLK